MVNALGTAFGGVIMSWIDVVAAMVAQRHCEGIVVTASVDTMSFLEPIDIGDHVILKASVNYVGRTSLEIGVAVNKENPINGKQNPTTAAYLTFVHLDEDGEPTDVPKLLLETEEDKRRNENAHARVHARRELRKKIRK